MEIGLYGNAVSGSFLQFPQVAVQKINAVGIVYFAVQEDPVVAALTVLCDSYGFAVALIDQPRSPVQHFRGDRPLERSARVAGIFFGEGKLYILCVCCAFP